MIEGRIPDYIFNPGEKRIFSLGCREDDTFVESAMVITRNYVYVVGEFIVKESGRQPSGAKGFKVIDLKSVSDVKEVTIRIPFLFIMFLILIAIFIMFMIVDLRIPVLDALPNYLYEAVVFTLGLGFFLTYVVYTKKIIHLYYREGEIIFRNHLPVPWEINRAKERIFEQQSTLIAS
jgi:hypothetical protein